MQAAPVGNGQRMILMARADGGEPFWAYVDDVLDALNRTLPLQTPVVPRVLTDDDRKKGILGQRFGVPREDAKEVAKKFPEAAALALARHEKAVADEKNAKGGKTPVVTAAAQTSVATYAAVGVGVAALAFFVLRRR